MKTYRNREQGKIRSVDESNTVTIAALEKLGWEEVTADDIENEPSLSVTHKQVAKADVPQEPPALPHLDKPVQETPTPKSGAITREDAAPLTGGKK